MTGKDATEASAVEKSPLAAVIIILVVVAIFAGVLLAKATNGSSDASTQVPGNSASSGSVPVGAVTITSTHNDAVTDYEAALATGKPVYVLFHSLSCQPCVEISAVADKIMPGYEGKVVFVNAISDDPSGQQLASRFQFQYIPTSFFITPDGKVADSFTGAMSDVDMKARLDKLIAQ
ncbi:MAG: thioredoxin family protein [Actinobacteria bacterium]|nr:thioredoxin family protein [Actinomycetota bacterium]